jgi:succinyl-CoA synthetase beta subunit
VTKLLEYKSKELFKKEGIPVSEGRVLSSAADVAATVEQIGCPVAVKGQAFITSRAKSGIIRFADTVQEAQRQAAEILSLSPQGHRVEKILVEKKLSIHKEYYAGIIVNDALRSPMVIFSSMGGSGIEELAEKYPDKVAYLPVNIQEGLREYEARNMLIKVGVPSEELLPLADMLVRLYRVARKYEARSAEINPVALTEEGKFYALDGRIVVDDNAVYRHPELGIEVAREIDHPPTELDRIAYKVEADDYRGTFYFMQLETEISGPGYVGFHGAGGGGSMMGMDALMRAGFKVPNFCDTSGNPPASKIYRAAKIILSQPCIEGYFHSGSGVASQEQFHIARGLVKAFREVNLAIPAVIRLGGNSEEEGIRIIQEYTRDLPAEIEVYGRNTSVDYCAQRLKELVDRHRKVG